MIGYTPAPWGWRRFGKALALVGEHADRPIVMDFVRSGMQGATPRFRNDLGLMCAADRDPVADDFADARLIAAAPAMLEALRKIAAAPRLDLVDEGSAWQSYRVLRPDEHGFWADADDTIEIARAAIAAATGEDGAS